MAVKLNCKYLSSFVSESEIADIRNEISDAYEKLYSKKAEAEGNDFHGWLSLPVDYDKEEFARIKA